MVQNNKVKVTAEAGKQELFIVREFDAPREDVFRAYTDPEILVHWLGPKNMKMVIDHYDARKGGGYRYIHTDPKGMSYTFNGVIHEALAPELLIQTFEYEGLPGKGHVSLDVCMMDELPGERTKLTIQSIFRSVAARDGMISAGMERGLSEGFERLDGLLAEKRK